MSYIRILYKALGRASRKIWILRHATFSFLRLDVAVFLCAQGAGKVVNMNSLLIRFIVSVAFASGTLALKADIVSAQECCDDFENLKTVLVNNPTATIAQKKTPWIFVRPDGKSGFANDFTTNAISVVSEDGVNYYAHVEGENGDRTKVIHFTVDENGIPSKHGDVIETTVSGEENNAEETED